MTRTLSLARAACVLTVVASAAPLACVPRSYSLRAEPSAPSKLDAPPDRARVVLFRAAQTIDSAQHYGVLDLEGRFYGDLPLRHATSELVLPGPRTFFCAGYVPDTSVAHLDTSLAPGGVYVIEVVHRDGRCALEPVRPGTPRWEELPDLLLHSAFGRLRDDREAEAKAGIEGTIMRDFTKGRSRPAETKLAPGDGVTCLGACSGPGGRGLPLAPAVPAALAGCPRDVVFGSLVIECPSLTLFYGAATTEAEVDAAEAERTVDAVVDGIQKRLDAIFERRDAGLTHPEGRPLSATEFYPVDAAGVATSEGRGFVVAFDGGPKRLAVARCMAQDAESARSCRSLLVDTLAGRVY